MFSALKSWWLGFNNPWPHARPLPAHVQAVRLDEKLLLHMIGCSKPSDRTNTGYTKPMKDKAA